jgi:5-aminopentanamidase
MRPTPVTPRNGTPSSPAGGVVGAGRAVDAALPARADSDIGVRGPVVVAAVQVPAVIDRPDPTIVERGVRAAAARGARLVVLPELAICGYAFDDAAEARAAAEPLDGPTVRLLERLSAELGLVIVAGLAERAVDGRVFDTAVLAEAGALRASYRKVHLWGRESELFDAGSAPPPVVETAAGRVALMVCYDLEFPEWARLAAQAGAEIVAAPVNWPARPGPHGERPLEIVKAQAAAGTYRVHVVVADRCGAERGLEWFGASVICGADGHLRAGPAGAVDVGPPGTAGYETGRPRTSVPALLTAALDLAEARDKRLGPYNDALTDRRPELYRETEPYRDTVVPEGARPWPA